MARFCGGHGLQPCCDIRRGGPPLARYTQPGSGRDTGGCAGAWIKKIEREQNKVKDTADTASDLPRSEILKEPPGGIHIFPLPSRFYLLVSRPRFFYLENFHYLYLKMRTIIFGSSLIMSIATLGLSEVSIKSLQASIVFETNWRFTWEGSTRMNKLPCSPASLSALAGISLLHALTDPTSG